MKFIIHHSKYLFVLLTLFSCNNIQNIDSSTIIGKNAVDVQSILETIYYQKQNSGKKFWVTEGNKNEALIIEIDIKTDAIINSFYSPYVNSKQLAKYIHRTYDEIAAEVGPPYENRDIADSNEIDFISIYFQKSSHIFKKKGEYISSYVYILEFNTKSELVSFHEMYWARP